MLPSKFAVFFCAISVFISTCVCGYEGEEIVEDFYSTIRDVNRPTLSDLKELEEFLRNGHRPYLRPIGLLSNKRNCRNIMLLGENGEAPIRKIYAVNTSKEDKKRCIALYGSFNYPYPHKVRTLLSELRTCGYKGHILLRIGGYPNLQNGGLRLAHIPYAWKLAALLEMRALGYQEILWLDSAMHPLNDLEGIFRVIRKQGHFFSGAGFPLSYPYDLGQHLPGAVRALGVPEFALSSIPHLSTQLIGMNTSYKRVNRVLDTWLEKVLKVTPCINWYPEELAFSVVAYTNGIGPTKNFGDVVFTKKNFKKSRKNRRDFFWDQHREQQPLWSSAELN